MATIITPTIVTINQQITEAPQPSQLQQSAAIVSAGGTTLAAGAYLYAGQLATVTGILAAPLAITGLTWSSGTVTATVAAMALSVGQVFTTTIAGATPAGYNGTYVATVASSTTFTFTLATNPGAETVPGTYTPPYSAFVLDAATTFFAQGSAVGVYILELGVADTETAAIALLTTWLTNNVGIFYALQVDTSWDSTALATLAGDYSNPTARLYFFFDTTEANAPNYTVKSVFMAVPAPTAPVTEVTSAAMMYQWVSQNPSAVAPAGPMAFRILYGVTAWPYIGQSTAINAILTANANLVYPGTEGGLPNSNLLFRGRTADGNQAMFWYAVDWFQIQVKLNLANAVINGSNQNPPVVYNQRGINTLWTVAQDTANSSVKFGLNLTATVTAQSFASYTAQNPANYAAGIYGGFAATTTPELGFESITFNIDATTFA